MELLLKEHNLEFTLLSNSLEANEKHIQELKNIIHNYKINHVKLMETISQLQKKRDCACESLSNANIAHNNNIRIIQELKDELEQIRNRLKEMEEPLQGSTIELPTNSQVLYRFKI